MIKKLIDKFKKRKADNKGFTLVELMVAIAILALVVVPTLQVFVTSTKTNSKARTELQATITANSVLESAKAFSLRVFHEQCAKDYKANPSEKFTLLAGQINGGSLKSFVANGGWTGVIGMTDGKINIAHGSSFTPDTLSQTSIYRYCINGIKQSNNSYDAVVVFEEQPYQDVTMSNASGSSSTSYKESQAQSTFGDYNKKFKITVYVYKHEDVPVYSGKSTLDANYLAKITGNKLDNAK